MEMEFIQSVLSSRDGLEVDVGTVRGRIIVQLVRLEIIQIHHLQTSNLMNIKAGQVVRLVSRPLTLSMVPIRAKFSVGEMGLY
jgi:hypothetical protein